ncbi:MAG: hybrid sensor histidine kinase/response regulator [Cyanobacteria bacterium]|nr:hybrid sensor histidine kinase/response regulator [Cyanobacteriota bacterium]
MLQVLEDTRLVQDTTTRSLKILLIEDSQDDAESIVKRIEKEIPNITYERVSQSAQFEQKIIHQKWDLILSDYTLTSFSVLDALHILKKQAVDIPFIVISSPVAGMDIVAAMKAGAHDFIPRDNLFRLFASIQNELRDASQRAINRESSVNLQHEKDSADSANNRKSRVLAFVAHEFKNPLNATLMFGEMLEKEAIGMLLPQQKEFVQNMLSSCHHLKDLIEDILAIGPVETGRFNVVLEEVSLQAILQDVKIMVQTSSSQKNVQLLFNVQEGIERIIVDPKRLKQILINLISNAIKYTREDDTVILKIYKQDEPSSDEQWIVYQITDHGPGIDEKELQGLFKDYYRIKNILSPQEEGLGLGLALTQKLVDAHHGVLTINSRLGVGSIFSVKLPV